MKDLNQKVEALAQDLGLDLSTTRYAGLRDGVEPNLLTGATSRLILGGAFGYNLLLNAGLRYSRANELGLLGFGGDRRDSRSWLGEGSVAVLLDSHWAVGMEYRQKPDNLSFAGESDWQDLFIGYFPSKRLSVVLAYARLGEIATLDNQDGVYLSIQGSF